MGILLRSKTKIAVQAQSEGGGSALPYGDIATGAPTVEPGPPSRPRRPSPVPRLLTAHPGPAGSCVESAVRKLRAHKASAAPNFHACGYPARPGRFEPRDTSGGSLGIREARELYGQRRGGARTELWSFSPLGHPAL